MTILFNTAIISKFKAEMFSTLLYKHHLSTSTPKLIDFDPEYNDDDIPAIKGYYFVKDNTKYILNKDGYEGKNNLTNLPIRVKSTTEISTKGKDVVQVINGDFQSFKVNPIKVYTLKQIDEMDGITHQDPDTWTLLKIISWVAYCRRINTFISGIRESGKTSYLDALAQMTDKGYVVKQPRSIVGIAPGLIPDGYIVLDEMGGLTSEIKMMIRNFLYQQGEFNPEFKTGKGAALAHNLMARYDISNLSCIILSNLIEDYADPEKNFFHYMFDNSQAINIRFFPLRINSPSTPTTEQLRKKLNCYLDAKQFKSGESGTLTPEIRDKYIGILKSMEWYKKNWDSLVNWVFVDNSIRSKVRGRHYLTYKELLGGIYVFCVELTEGDESERVLKFNKYKNLLDTWHKNYNDTLLDTTESNEIVEVEDVK